MPKIIKHAWKLNKLLSNVWQVYPVSDSDIKNSTICFIFIYIYYAWHKLLYLKKKNFLCTEDNNELVIDDFSC